MRRSEYAIADEPAPGRFQAYVVSPFIPLLATMLAGSLLGLPWLVFNGWAMGAMTRKRDTVIAVVTWLAQANLMLLAVMLVAFFEVPPRWIAYNNLLASIVVLTGGYVIQLSQDASFELHRYFGGQEWPRGWQMLGVCVVLRMVVLSMVNG